MNSLNSYRDSFNEKGFAFINNFLSISEKENILRTFFYICTKYIKIKEEVCTNLDIENQDFHYSLIQLRENSPEKFSDLYDELKLNASIRSIFYSSKFMNSYSSLLGVNQADLFINGFMVRLDVPFDTKNTLKWHQDSPYYMQSFPYFNGAVCWIPLTKNTAQNGTLKYIPSTHEKLIENITSSKLNSNKYSIQHALEPDSEQNKNIKDMNGKIGDMTALHFHIIHKSGENTSSKVRITLACRYHDVSKSFHLGQDTYIYKRSGSREFSTIE